MVMKVGNDRVYYRHNKDESYILVCFSFANHLLFIKPFKVSGLARPMKLRQI